MESLDYLLQENPVIWVFGYGSLLWKPDFSYKSKVVGFIEGYERRFNQGNETFRGIPGKPGRVANLEAKTGCKTWGVAYEISGREEVSKVLKDLYVRESMCGGYGTMITTFYPRDYIRLNQGNGHSSDSSAFQDQSCSIPQMQLISANQAPILPHVTDSNVTINPSTSHSDIGKLTSGFDVLWQSHQKQLIIEDTELAGDIPKEHSIAAETVVPGADIPLPEDSHFSSEQFENEKHTDDLSRTDSKVMSESVKSSTEYRHQASHDINRSSDSSETTPPHLRRHSQAPGAEQESFSTVDAHNKLIHRNSTPGDFSTSRAKFGTTATATTLDQKITADGNTSTCNNNAATSGQHAVKVLLYTATPDNDQYLGPDTMTAMARQIVESKGTAGTNVEYVLKIAKYAKQYIPEDNDEYLFELDAQIKEELYRRINLQRVGSEVGQDVDVEHNEALLKAIRVTAS